MVEPYQVETCDFMRLLCELKGKTVKSVFTVPEHLHAGNVHRDTAFILCTDGSRFSAIQPAPKSVRYFHPSAEQMAYLSEFFRPDEVFSHACFVEQRALAEAKQTSEIREFQVMESISSLFAYERMDPEFVLRD